MLRRITMVAVPMAFVLPLFVAGNSTSQAFARGGRGGHGVAHNHRGFDRHSRHFQRYGWGYTDRGYFGYETTVCDSTDSEPVVAAPVSTTCEPTYDAVYSTASYDAVYSTDARFWGSRHGRNHFHNVGRFHGQDGHHGGRRR
ncbi:MAG TPA: hypothetical protein VMR25_10795 [Planctomycetaceae bacterium]|jgi:hypothetical protein|nr:hypothetical protein [Planctomycetaceae bacterium]